MQTTTTLQSPTTESHPAATTWQPPQNQWVDDRCQPTDVPSHPFGKAFRFEIQAEPRSRVFIAGTFNGWAPTTHRLRYHPKDGVFGITLYLEPGTYEYKFVVNGVWRVDVKCPHWKLNDNGTLNSVLRVK